MTDIVSGPPGPQGEPATAPVPRTTSPVQYKVVDQPWQPSDPAATQAMLDPVGQEGWLLTEVRPDPRREKTRWVFTQGGAAPIPVQYKVLDAPYSPSGPAASQALLDAAGQGGWQLAAVYPDPQREKTRWVFSQGGAAGAAGVAGTDGQVQYNNAGAPGGAANFTILSGNPNVTAGNKYLYDGADVLHGDAANANFYFGNAGRSTSGSYCLAIGQNAMQSSTGGQHNIAIGDQAMSANTAGADNIAMGASCLVSNTTGYDNLSFGTYGMYHNTTGYENVSIGRASLSNNTVGNDNTAIGVRALYSSTSHVNNTAIGFNALYSADSDDNTGLGYQAGYDVTTGSYNTFVGAFSGQHVTTGGFNTFVGRSSGANVGGGAFNTIVGSSGGVAGMTSTIILADGNGLVSFCNDVANGNIGIGPNQYYSSIGGRAGIQCISIGIGSGAGLSSGNINTFLGANSGKLVTTGNYNTIVGSYTGAATMSNQVVLADGNGSVAAQYDVPNKTWQMPTTTVGALPAAGVVGRRAFVTDAVASSFYTMATGGGTIKVPVFDDGANWRIG